MRMSMLAVNEEKLRTIEITNIKLVRYLDEIRPTNKAYSNMLFEVA